MARRVLVVEDDPAVQYFVTGTLQDEGYEVVTAADGQVGLGAPRQGRRHRHPWSEQDHSGQPPSGIACAPIAWQSGPGSPPRPSRKEPQPMDVPRRPYSFGVPWEQGYGFAQAIQVGPTLYISGQLSHDQDANFVGEGDFELQVRTSFANLDRVLEAYGARREDVVQTTVYVKELRHHFDAMARLHAEYFGAHRPTSTVLGVVDLALPAQLVEIAAVAVVPEHPSEVRP